jgi:hypothetical protein
MSSRFTRIAAGTLLSGALFMGAGAAPAFADEGEDGNSNNSTQKNVAVQIGVSGPAIAVNTGSGSASATSGNVSQLLVQQNINHQKIDNSEKKVHMKKKANRGRW